MDLIYVMLILLVCLIIIGILCYLLINRNQSKETITEEKSENSMVVKNEQPSYFPAIQIRMRQDFSMEIAVGMIFIIQIWKNSKDV